MCSSDLLALSWVKTHLYDLGITNKRAQDPLRIPDAMIDVHLHLPRSEEHTSELQSPYSTQHFLLDPTDRRDTSAQRDLVQTST